MTKPKERDLDEVEAKLWEIFDEASKRHSNYSDPSYTDSSNADNFRIKSRNSLANIGAALAAVKREIRVEKMTAEQQKIEEEMDKGLKSGVTPLNPIKLKQPGDA